MVAVFSFYHICIPLRDSMPFLNFNILLFVLLAFNSVVGVYLLRIESNLEMFSRGFQYISQLNWYGTTISHFQSLISDN